MAHSAFFIFVFVLRGLNPMPSDTPPAPPAAAQLAALHSVSNVLAVTLLEDGTRAPAQLQLPNLTNRRQTLEYMLANYPRVKKSPASTSEPVAWVFVDKHGMVSSATVVIGNGNPELDALAVKAFKIATFTPAMLGTDSVGVWVPFPARVPPREELDDAIAALDGDDDSQKPHATHFTEAPVLLNRTRVEESVVRYIYNVNQQIVGHNEQFYRAQRAGGKTLLWVYIDENGEVRNSLIKKSSGNTDIDNYSLQIAAVMRFSPAKDNGKAVSAWIEVPLDFRAR